MRKIWSLLVSLVLFGGVIMSPIGGRDYGALDVNDPGAILLDNSEIVSRLKNGMGSFYRSGSWLYADDFEAGIRAWNLVSGTLAVNTTNGQVYQGAQSARITTPASVNGIAEINKSIGAYPTRMGIEMMIQFPTTIGWDFIIGWSYSEYHVGSKSAFVRLRAPSFPNYTLQYMNSSGVYVDFLTLPDLDTGTLNYHSVKLIADFNTGKYAGIYFDGVYYDMSSFNMYVISDPSSTSNYMLFADIQVMTYTAVAKGANLDNIILTKDEP